MAGGVPASQRPQPPRDGGGGRLSPSVPARPAVWRAGAPVAGHPRTLAEEVAVAITYNRETFAVMLATPSDIEDFATGFSLTEGAIAHAADIEELECLAAEGGIEARLWLAPERIEAVRDRRRRLAGPTGCGLCGIDSLREAVRPPPPVTAPARVTPAQIAEAQRAMEARQALGRATRAVHAAALWHPARGLIALREDVGRHNALDKLVGAVARLPDVPVAECLLLLSSRVSIELVQKACVLGAPVLVAVSAPTAHAVRLAEQAGLTLVAVARADGFEVFSAPHRLVQESVARVA